jgi:hypothetical protein
MNRVETASGRYDAGDETPAEAAIAGTVRGRKVWFGPIGRP